MIGLGTPRMLPRESSALPRWAYTGTQLITKVKQRWSHAELGWVTTPNDKNDRVLLEGASTSCCMGTCRKREKLFRHINLNKKFYNPIYSCCILFPFTRTVKLSERKNAEDRLQNRKGFMPRLIVHPSSLNCPIR